MEPKPIQASTPVTPNEYKNLGKQKFQENLIKQKKQRLDNLTHAINQKLNHLLNPQNDQLPIVFECPNQFMFISLYDEYIEECRQNQLIKQLEQSGWFIQIWYDSRNNKWYRDDEYAYRGILIWVSDQPKKNFRWFWQKEASLASPAKQILYQTWNQPRKE